MAENIFSSPVKKIPTSDAMTLRVDMEQQDIGGRKSHLPAQDKNSLTISHVPNADSKT